jgi:hypothetical protein
MTEEKPIFKPRLTQGKESFLSEYVGYISDERRLLLLENILLREELRKCREEKGGR